MVKRIICLALCVLFCFGAVGCKEEEGSVLTIGIESINTEFYPFSQDGDGTLRDIVFTKLIELDESGKPFFGEESSAISQAFRVYFTDGNFSESEAFAEGGYTAFEFTLKNGILFSDGTPLTSQDVLFSVYCAIDPKAGYLAAEALPIAGLDNYIYQSADAADRLAIASEILSKGRNYIPTEEDSFDENESKIYWDAFSLAGENFVSKIVSYVNAEYCTDELVASYIFEGFTGEAVKNSEALSNTYAMRLWNYGNYTYSYIPDENGIFVGVGDDVNGYSYKTTLEKALESDDYTVYVADDNGMYVYDRITAKYRLYEEGDTEKRFSRVLSDKYIILSKNSLTGFRDMAGKLYTLEGEDFPTFGDFFSLMCVAYTENGILDYARMESVEAANEGDSFTKESADVFASTLVESHSVDNIEGIKLESSEEDGILTEKLTVYIEGNKWDKVYYLTFPIVSKAHYTEGYSYDSDTVITNGVALASESFFEHIKERSASPLGAGAYCFGETEDKGNTVILKVNKEFNAVSSEFISVNRYDSIKFTALDNDPFEAVSNGMVDISLVPASENTSSEENIKSFFCPGFSYDYVVINPACYININTRRALLSVMNVALATGGDINKEVYSYMPSFMWANSVYENISLYEESGEDAKKYFEKAGYTFGESGELIDPATKQQAFFSLTLLPAAKGTAVERVFLKASEILNSIGAKSEIVYDGDLMMNIYSDGGVGIYSLGWESDMVGSLYMRYAFSSMSDSVKANGIKALHEGGQIDNFGTVAFSDGEGNILEYNQAAAAATLEALILQGDSSVVLEDKKASYAKAMSLIRELSFELPLCQRGGVFFVNGASVDVSTVNFSPTVFASLISKPWKLCPVISE